VTIFKECNTVSDPPGSWFMDRVGVVGCGLMGSGITEGFARAGLDVVVVERDHAALAIGMRRIEQSLARAVGAGKLSGVERERTLSRITPSTEVGELFDRQLVVEAVGEDEAVKVLLFQQLDKVINGDDTILAPNTSSIPIMKLGSATSRPEARDRHPLL
jgi:3-hydroxybutyryl-CoA dehydrogenase